jgi:hypothetical protein
MPVEPRQSATAAGDGPRLVAKMGIRHDARTAVVLSSGRHFNAHARIGGEFNAQPSNGNAEGPGSMSAIAATPAKRAEDVLSL